MLLVEDGKGHTWIEFFQGLRVGVEKEKGEDTSCVRIRAALSPTGTARRVCTSHYLTLPCLDTHKGYMDTIVILNFDPVRLVVFVFVRYGGDVAAETRARGEFFYASAAALDLN